MSDSPHSAIVPLSRTRAKLAQPRGAKRLDALLSQPNAPELIAKLPGTEVFELVKSVGLADSLDLIALAQPDQLRCCLDLDVWDRDRVLPASVEPWLEAVLDGGYERFGDLWAGLDTEFTALLLARWTLVYDHSLEEEVPDAEERPIFKTPDTFFSVVITARDATTVGLVQQILDALYRADMVLARHTIMAAKTEPLAELEEMSHRWRSGRMADLGFVDYYDALRILAPIEIDSVRARHERIINADASSTAAAEPPPDVVEDNQDEAGRQVGALPISVAELVMGRAFLARAIDELGAGADADRLEKALVVAINRVMSALRVEPGDEERVQDAADYAVSTLALGLENLAGGELPRAADYLRTTPLSDIHRVGVTLTLRLARVARALAPRAVTLGEPAEAVIAALSRRQPLFPCDLDDSPRADSRPFASVYDLQRVAVMLTKTAVKIAIAGALEIDLVAAAELEHPPALDDFVRTALVRVLADGELTAAPLTQEELAELALAFADGSLTKVATTRVLAAVEKLLEDHKVQDGRAFIPELVTSWLNDICEDFAAAITAGIRDFAPESLGRVIAATTRA